MSGSSSLSGLVMGVNIVCTLKIDGKHDFWLFYLPEDKNKMQLSLSHRVRQAAGDDSYPIIVNYLNLVTSQTCDLPSLLHACPFYSLKSKIFVEN